MSLDKIALFSNLLGVPLFHFIIRASSVQIILIEKKPWKTPMKFLKLVTWIFLIVINIVGYLSKYLKIAMSVFALLTTSLHLCSFALKNLKFFELSIILFVWMVY